MIIYHQNNVGAFKGNHVFYNLHHGYASYVVGAETAAPSGRIMSSLAGGGGLVFKGGMARKGGGLAA